jgi:hypothetical protein
MTLKGQCNEIFDFRFCTWISFPKPLIIPLGTFQIFSKIRGDFAAQGAPPMSLTPVAIGKNLDQKSFHYFFSFTILNTEISTLGIHYRRERKTRDEKVEKSI